MRKHHVIRVENLGKCYAIYDKPHHRLLQSIFRHRKTLFREFWALRGVSFEVMAGETVAIIGRNGSGKSTLLQMICGTLNPTLGSVDTHGRIAALLELGSGFNPEFTGMENVHMNASILGLSRSEIEQRLPRIIEFAEIGQFIDQPVKTYSSGMLVRLAFSVAIHVDPSILIVDEALGVGDMYFQAKCARKLDEIKAKGTTILFVSHDTSAVQRLCDRCVVLDQGKMVYQGDVATATSVYYGLLFGSDAVAPLPSGDIHTAPHEGDASAGEGVEIELRRHQVVTDNSAYIDAVRIFRTDLTASTVFQVGETAHFTLIATALQDLDDFEAGLGICDRTGMLLGGAHSLFGEQARLSAKAGNQIIFKLDIKLDLAPGEYLVTCGIARNFGVRSWEDLYLLRDAFVITIVGAPTFWGLFGLPSSATCSVQ